jgi:hypothetical protein
VDRIWLNSALYGMSKEEKREESIKTDHLRPDGQMTKNSDSINVTKHRFVAGKK